jgi:hypothetical protein
MKRLIFTVLIVIFCLIGEVLCIFKMIRCNWEPVGKAEIVYTVGVFTGTGAIVGWINIEDN